MSKGLELVVARYAEDLKWLRRIPREFQITVYDKGGDLESAISLPNVGNEAQTYLHHIVTRYDSLADLTVFAQGRPFDHVPDFHRRMRRLAAERDVAEFCWLGLVVDYDDPEGRRLFKTWTKNPEGRLLNLNGFFQELWQEASPDRLVFYPGAQFIVSAATIRSQPRSFYERALLVSETYPDAGHCLERSWDRIFAVEGLPESLRNREFPIYLRPIKRLGIGWDQVPEDQRGW